MKRPARDIVQVIHVTSLLILFAGYPLLVKAKVLTNNIALYPSFLPDMYLLEQGEPSTSNHLFAIYYEDSASGQYTFGYAAIDEPYAVHAASSGVEFTPSYVIADPPLLNNWNTPGSFQLSLALNESILLAYWDDNSVGMPPIGSTYNVPDDYDYYGWFQLTRTPGGLIVTDSATAFGGGIIVGTYTQIPEPSTVFLIAGAILGTWVIGFPRSICQPA